MKKVVPLPEPISVRVHVGFRRGLASIYPDRDPEKHYGGSTVVTVTCSTMRELQRAALKELRSFIPTEKYPPTFGRKELKRRASR